jgi:ribosomal protein S18 acetylase RimI-like enzyme
MHIEFFTSDQLETVADLFHDMSVHYNGSDASERSAVKRNLIENILGDHSGVRLVIASANGRAVGLASIAILYPASRERGQLFMKEIYVLSSYRGRGIGKELIRFVARHALETGCIRLDWTVDADNERALKFYRDLGARVAQDKIYFRVTGEDLERLAATDKSVSHVG